MLAGRVKSHGVKGFDSLLIHLVMVTCVLLVLALTGAATILIVGFTSFDDYFELQFCSLRVISVLIPSLICLNGCKFGLPHSGTLC